MIHPIRRAATNLGRPGLPHLEVQPTAREQDRRPDVLRVAAAFKATLDRNDLIVDPFRSSVGDRLRAEFIGRIPSTFLCDLCASVFQLVRVRAAFWKHRVTEGTERRWERLGNGSHARFWLAMCRLLRDDPMRWGAD